MARVDNWTIAREWREGRSGRNNTVRSDGVELVRLEYHEQLGCRKVLDGQVWYLINPGISRAGWYSYRQLVSSAVGWVANRQPVFPDLWIEVFDLASLETVTEKMKQRFKEEAEQWREEYSRRRKCSRERYGAGARQDLSAVLGFMPDLPDASAEKLRAWVWPNTNHWRRRYRYFDTHKADKERAAYVAQLLTEHPELMKRGNQSRLRVMLAAYEQMVS